MRLVQRSPTEEKHHISDRYDHYDEAEAHYSLLQPAEDKGVGFSHHDLKTHQDSPVSQIKSDILAKVLGPLHQIILSGIISFPLPWVFESAPTERYGNFPSLLFQALLYTFPLQFILTIDLISKSEFSIHTNVVSRAYIFLQITNLTAFAYEAAGTAALISSQMLCWLLLLEIRLEDKLYLSHIILVGYIYTNLVYTAFCVDDISYVMKESGIILNVMGTALVMRMLCGCTFWSIDGSKLKKILFRTTFWSMLVLHAVLVFLFLWKWLMRLVRK